MKAIMLTQSANGRKPAKHWVLTAGMCGSKGLGKNINNSFFKVLRAYNLGFTVIDEALQRAPRYAEAYKAIGNVYTELGDTANLIEAVAHYKRYWKLAPNATDWDFRTTYATDSPFYQHTTPREVSL